MFTEYHISVENDAKPKFKPSVAGRKVGVSKRSEYNELDSRATLYAMLILFARY